jgi:hypothetical protein
MRPLADTLRVTSVGLRVAGRAGWGGRIAIYERQEATNEFVLAAAAAAVLGMVTAPAASAQQTLSQRVLRQPADFWDRIFRRPFAGGERITASATAPVQGSPTQITLLYRGVVVDTAPFPGELTYTIREHRVATDLRFETDSGAVTWNIDCAEPDPDIDDDGLSNRLDNCASIANADQADNDRDLRGDVCDADDDNDFVVDATDNCQFAANYGQEDADADGKGAACDTQELPLSKEDCQGDGWRRFDGTATFANLGQCMRFVAAGGTHPRTG